MSAFISWHKVTAPVAELPALALRHQVRPPALIVIGGVVTLREKLTGNDLNPVYAEQASTYVPALREQA